MSAVVRACRAAMIGALCVCGAPGRIAAQTPGASRATIGLALGGGSARGLAHIGVLRWFEEHRIPVDLVAGTSMGGLVDGAFASGMSAGDLERLLADTDWNEAFGRASYRFKNIRRKQDARAYPSRLELGAKHGLSVPIALNNGQQVDLLLSRIGAAYGDRRSFDDLPTPFRCVALDLRTATPVILDRGSLALALRATMSVPGVFPPVEIGSRVLVDGGALNNVPADVVRAMGADVVIAVNVGSMSETRRVTTTMFGLMGGTVDAMMLASTRRGMAAADIVINPDLDAFGSLDWRRAGELADRGYRAAEALRARLLPFALDEEAWRAYVAARQARRAGTLPIPATLLVTGATVDDARAIRSLIAPRIGKPLDVAALASDLETLGGLDRYETLGWDMVQQDGRPALLIRARAKPNAPPFLMLTTTLQNTTTDDFSFQLAARYLAFDVAGPRSELRIDLAVGSNPDILAELYQPLGGSPFFVTAGGGLVARRFNLVQDGAILGQYDQHRVLGESSVGVNLGRDSELRAGFRAGRLDADRQVGDPVLPTLKGLESELRLRWIYDGQDHSVIPSGGARAVGTVRHVLAAPDLPPTFSRSLSNDRLTQADLEGSVFWSARQHRDRVFATGGIGSSFGDHPLPTDEFAFGQPLRLGAFDVGERRGPSYAALTVGYLRGVGRLPDFLGGPIFAGGWLENGSVFARVADARLDTHAGMGIVLDTLVGPALAGLSVGFDGRYRYYIAIGRVFP